MYGGSAHTCSRLDRVSVRCWGSGGSGALGYGNTNNIGDNEAPSSAGDVPVGIAVVGLAAGKGHSCAITAGGTIRCWGNNDFGQLGHGNSNSIGDNEAASAAGDVSAIPIGLPPTTKTTALALGQQVSCALYETGDVLCWGRGSKGQLG